ncbi:MAG: substrate-binding domain-containing protein [Lentisphaeria bacterium]|nr:substrate-binding domain-containing protein [Lentisphaeria bacterium]
MATRKNKTNGSRAQMREAILSGHYLAGTYLPSARELAKELNISKSSVHNILKLLQEEGLIRIYPNCGALVLENGANRNDLKCFFVRPSDYGTFRYLPVTAELLQGISAGAEKKNCEMHLSFSDSGRMTDEIIAHCMAGTIQGMIYLQCRSFNELCIPLEKAGVPCVIAADNMGHENAVRTFIDYRAVARAAVRHLVGKGHRKIGIIAGAEKDFLYSEMLAGFRGALAEENVPLDPRWVIAGLGYEQVADQVGVLVNHLKSKEPPTAFFTVRDYRAGWLFEAAKRLKLAIPEAFSVLSYDNHSWKGAEAHGLTSFAEPLRAQGEAAVELLRGWVASGVRPESVEFRPELVERSSVRAIEG